MTSFKLFIILENHHPNTPILKKRTIHGRGFKALQSMIDLIKTQSPLFERSVSVMANDDMVENVDA